MNSSIEYNIKELSICSYADGFSFCIKDIDNSILDKGFVSSVEEITLDNVSKIDKLQLIYQGLKHEFIPCSIPLVELKPHLNSNRIVNKIPTADYLILFDAPKSNALTSIISKSENIEIKHSLEICIERVNKLIKKDFSNGLYINVFPSAIDYTVVKYNKIVDAGIYPTTDINDKVYYALHLYKKHGLFTKSNTLKVIGKNVTPVYDKLNEFFQKVEIDSLKDVKNSLEYKDKIQFPEFSL